jgi:hypothetical protein
MRDETADTFDWLFTTFKMCMGGHEPHVLLIGQYYWCNIYEMCLFLQYVK